MVGNGVPNVATSHAAVVDQSIGPFRAINKSDITQFGQNRVVVCTAAPGHGPGPVALPEGDDLFVKDLFLLISHADGITLTTGEHIKIVCQRLIGLDR